MKYSQDMKAKWKIIKPLINGSQGTTAAEIFKIDGKWLKITGITGKLHSTLIIFLQELLIGS